jgi:hypothetical protein
MKFFRSLFRRVGTRCYVEVAKDLVQENEKTRINPDVCKNVVLKIVGRSK